MSIKMPHIAYQMGKALGEDWMTYTKRPPMQYQLYRYDGRPFLKPMTPAQFESVLALIHELRNDILLPLVWNSKNLYQ